MCWAKHVSCYFIRIYTDLNIRGTADMAKYRNVSCIAYSFHKVLDAIKYDKKRNTEFREIEDLIQRKIDSNNNEKVSVFAV